ncbi:MAG: helix-turn-helix domain-containing protein [Alphaproteobacteria bacterium]|nr:helix-turn-helix domain-containing protein [Alphaproteobacteria bacterium]
MKLDSDTKPPAMPRKPRRTSQDLLIGRRLRDRRKFLKQSLQDLSAQVGVSYQQIQKYESGQDRIPASILFSLSKALDTSPNYFFTRTLEDEVRELFPDITKEALAESMAFLYWFQRVDDATLRDHLLKMILHMGGEAGGK